MEKKLNNTSFLMLYILISMFIVSTCEVLSPGLGDEIDKSAPVVGIESHNNGAYVGGTIILSGFVTDDLEIKSVVISNVNGNSPATREGENWTLEYDTTQFNDGDHEVTVTATDKFNKTAQVTVLLIVDNSPPSVLVTTPSEYGTDQEFNKSITIKGEAADTTRVKSVSVSLYRSSDDVLVVDNVQATGTSSWYYIFDSTDFHGDALPVTEYYFFIEAKDYSGNSNSYFYHFEDILNISIDPASTPNIEEIKDSDYKNIDISGLSATLESVRKTVNSGSRMEIVINPDSDSPQFTLISPAANSVVPSDNIFSNPQNLTGFVSDDDIAGINASTLTLTITDWADDLVIVGTPAVYGVDMALLFSGSQWSYNSMLPDGEYGIQLQVEDASGVIGQSNRIPFKVSSSAPIITLDTPQQGVYIGKSGSTTVGVSVAGSVDDEVYIDLDGDLVYDDPGEKMTPLGAGQYEYTVIPGTNITLENGDDVFQIRAGVDPNFGTFILQYVGDINDPTVGFSYPADAQDVNGIINISGIAADNLLIKNVYVWVGTETDPASLPTDFTDPGWIVPTGKYNWTISNFDTNTLTDNTSYTIFVKAFDEAGNESDLTAAGASLSVTVNQESDRPIISLSNMSEGLNANGLAQDASIIGLIEDDDTVDVSSLEVRIDINNDDDFSGVILNGDGDILDANESEQWVPIIPAATSADDVRIFNWVYNLLNVPQGTHSMQIRVHDTDSDGITFNEALNPNYAELLETTFTIDYGPPSLVITSPPGGSIFNTDFIISGTAADPNTVTDVEISFDAGVSYVPVDTMDPAGPLVNWSHTFDVDEAGGTTDGDYSYQIRATDSSGGKSTLDRQFVVDATAPTIVIDLPPALADINGKTVPVQGTANDNRGVTAVYIDINPEGTAPPVDLALWDTTTGNYSWSYIFDSTLLNNTVIASNFVISMKAVDEAGNESAEYTRTISVDQTSDRPVISFNDVDKTKTVATDNVLVGATSLTGIIEDDDLINPSAIYTDTGAAIEINLDNAGWEPVSQPPATSGKLVVWKHDFPVGILEGEHTVKLRVRDNIFDVDDSFGASSASPEYSTNFNWNIEDSADLGGIPFILNLGPPSITIANPAQFSSHKTDVLIDGTAADANDVASMAISFDNGANWTDLGITAGSPVNWDYTLPAISGDDTYSFLVRATDTYGATTVENGLFTLDTTIPTVTITQPASGETVNGTITVGGTSGDNISLYQVHYRIDSSTDIVPAFPAGYSLFPGNYSWNAVIDTTDPAYPDDTYTLRVVSVDTATNESSVNFVNFVVDQNSDKPVISYSSILEGGTFFDNLIPASKQITGTITDDDGVDASTIQYQLYEEDGITQITTGWTAGEITAGWAVVSGAPGSDTTLSTWTHTFGAGIPDGKYWVKLRAADINAGEVFNIGEFDWSESPLIRLGIDTANPVTTFDTATGGATRVNLLISGTASDANGVTDVDLSFDGGTIWIPADNFTPGINEAWDYTYTLGADGLLTYQVRLTDEYNKEQTYDRYITVDTTPATVVINQPSSGATLNGEMTVRGTSDDGGTGVDEIYYSIQTAVSGEPAYPGSYTLASGNYNWSDTYDTSAIIGPTAYTLWVRSVDLAGNISAASSVNFTIDQSSDNPVISYSTLNDAGTFADNLLPLSKQISGTIEDDDNVDASTVQYRLYQENGITLIDDWTNVSSQPGSDGGFVTWSHTFGGTVTDGKYQVQIRAADINDGGVWDGSYDWTETSNVQFAVDTANPVTTFDTATGGATRVNLLISGTASDANGVTDVDLSFDGGTIWIPADNFTPGINEAWDYTYTLGADGLLTYQVRLTDEYNKEQTYDRYITVDTTPATVVINQPSSGATLNGEMTVRGTSDDGGTGVDEIYYSIQTAVSGEPAYPGSYTLASGNYNWSDTYDTSAIIGPTAYTLWVRSVDLAGNISAASSVNFTIDQSSDNPVIEYSSITEGGVFGVNELPLSKKISGTIEDDDAVDASTVQYRLYQENGITLIDDWTNVSGQPSSDATFASWSHTLGAGVTDGKYQIQIRAADINDGGVWDGNYDWTETALQQITVDTTFPTGSIVTLDISSPYDASTDPQPASAGMLVYNSFDLIGTAADLNGIASVSYSSDGTNYTAVDSFTEPNWSHTVAVARGGAGDGSMTLYIRIEDTVGKITDKTLAINVDTVEPTGVWDYNNELTKVAGITSLDGTNTKVVGSVEDTGDISNVDRVDVFFVKGSDFHSPRATASTAISGNSIPTDSSYIISVDNRFEIDSDSESPGDNDDFLEGLRSKGTYDEWYAYLNSTILPDGPIDVHFASYDGSGNRSIETETIQVANFPPAIDSIDIFGTNYTDSGVRVKADGSGNIVVYVSDHLSDPSPGIDATTYELEVIEQYSVISGDVGIFETSYDLDDTYLYDASDFNPEDTASGTLSFDTAVLSDDHYYRFEARIKDDDGIVATKDFYIWVYDAANDTQSPSVTLDTLSQSNITGGGHLEESIFSGDGDADVSGTIILTGTVYDDNQNPDVYIEIDQGSGFAIDGQATTSNQTGDSIVGYTYDWSYSWNTQTSISNVAQADIDIRVYGEDAKPNVTAIGSRPTETVDVVPYITNILTGLDVGLKTFVKRSALGRYTVANNAIITIQGYNLSEVAADSVSIGGVNFTPQGGSSTTSLSVDLNDTTTSGAVVVTTNLVPSSNNSNNNTLDQNLEAAPYYPDRNDDRYLSLWDLTDMLFVGDNAVMRPTVDGNADDIIDDMDWMYTSGSDSIKINSTLMTESFTLSGGDFEYNASGTRIWTFLNNARWWGDAANDNWEFYGSVQWSIETPAPYTDDAYAAYNFNVAGDRLGLGNYNFNGAGDLTRYKNVQIETNGTDAGTENYVAYYDGNSANKGIVYTGFIAGTAVTGTTLNTWNATISKDVANTSAYASAGVEKNARNTGINDPTYNSDSSAVRDVLVSGANSSEHFKLAYDSVNDIIYLAWYDPQNDAVKLMYNTAPDSELGAWTNWNTGATVAANSGMHINMVIDPAGGIHMAFLNSTTGYLDYAYLTGPTDTTVGLFTVDALFNAGQYIGMNIRDFGTADYRPLITSLSSAFLGSNVAIRMAYPTTVLGSLADGANSSTGDFSGDWEVIAVPALTIPSSSPSFVEMKELNVSDQLILGNPILGYNGSTMEEAEFLDLP
ncbi:MAG: Ig-like domain repeat protein [Spirochaetaceae bacterium]|nr:Ig-like domain repeat protein [Spirochaetaceae bacterium]